MRLPIIILFKFLTLSLLLSLISRQLSEQDLERDQNRNWALFDNSLLGGVLVYKYGNGSDKNVKQVLSAIWAHNKKEGNALRSRVKIRLAELQVKLSVFIDKI